MSNPVSWQYIAGFLDGEGSIVKRKSATYRILIPQTHEEVLEKIRGFSGVGFVYRCKTRKAHWKDNWVYAISRQKDALFFIKKVSPYLIVKRELALASIPKIETIINTAKQRKRKLQKRLKACKLLRHQGLTYRAIAKKLKIDFGYARRLFLHTQKNK